MQDIANISGYSITTISHVINRTRHVDSEARRKILDAAMALGYNTDRSMSSQKNRTIGMVIADIRVDYFSEVTKNVEGMARAAGYNLIFCDSEERGQDEAICVDMLLRHDVAGMIIAPCNIDADYSRVTDQGIPIVLIDRNLDSNNLDFVGIDNAQSASRLTQLLWEQGSRNIAFIGHKGPQFTTRERIAGYRSALLERGAYTAENVLLFDSHADKGPQEISDFLSRGPEFDGLVCQSPNACYETLDSLIELGQGYPERVRLASWDDTKWFDLMKYPISAISQPTGDIADVATELLIDKIESPKRHSIPKKIILEYELRVRS
jgi:LacI family transcriptional regulator